MISDGNATVFISNMDAAIRFYTEVLGLELTNRFGNDWATVRAGQGLTIGLHPVSPQYPAPGTRGAMALGLDLTISIENAVARLAKHGFPPRAPSHVASPAISLAWKTPTATRSIFGKRHL